MYEGLGCALENLVLAAQAKGYTYNLKLMPDPTSRTHVASINLETNTKSDNDKTVNITSPSSGPRVLSLYNAIPRRHTNRGPYDTNKPVTQDILQSLGSLKQTFGNALKELIADPNWQALMTFRIGYPTVEALSSPRRSIQEIVVSSV